MTISSLLPTTAFNQGLNIIAHWLTDCQSPNQVSVRPTLLPWDLLQPPWTSSSHTKRYPTALQCALWMVSWVLYWRTTHILYSVALRLASLLLTAQAESYITLQFVFCTVKRMDDGFMLEGKQAEVLRGGGSVRCLAGRPDHRANWVMTRIG